MDLSNMYSCPPAYVRYIELACLIWPFVAIGLLSKRTRSSALLLAMALPLAVTLAGTWMGIADSIRGMAISGSGGIASVAAGFAEALAMLGLGTLSALGVIVVALLRRHRPVADRVTTVLAFIVAADTIAVVLFLRFFTLRIAHLVFVGQGVAIAAAIALAVWLLLVARNVVHPRPLPMAASAILVCALVLGGVVWHHVRTYDHIARHGLPLVAR